MDEETLVREELIGRHVTIRECTDPKWNDKTGIIIDETKNTFLIEIDNKCIDPVEKITEEFSNKITLSYSTLF